MGAALAKDGSNAAGSMQTTSMILAAGQKLPWVMPEVA